MTESQHVESGSPGCPILPEDIVADILERWPQTIPVFLKYHTSCVGCSMSIFETLSDMTRIYHLPLERFIAELEQASRNNRT